MPKLAREEGKALYFDIPNGWGVLYGNDRDVLKQLFRMKFKTEKSPKGPWNVLAIRDHSEESNEILTAAVLAAYNKIEQNTWIPREAGKPTTKRIAQPEKKVRRSWCKEGCPHSARW